MKHIAILGFGREGTSLLAFLKKSDQYRDAEIWVLDRNQNIKAPKGVKTQLGKSYLKNLSRFETIFRSPGIPYRTPELLKAKREGVAISSATKLFFEHCKGTIIGITGTKGKGTTTTLLFKILKAAKKDVVLVGNIGVPALDLLPRIKKTTLVVFELSSFQLQDLTTAPHIAGLLDMFPDHQDSHLDLREYYSAKENITRFQNPHDTLFYIEGNKVVEVIAKKSKAKKTVVSTKKWRLFSPQNLLIPGAHNFKNAVMAGTIAHHLGISNTIIKKTVLSFKGNEHRLELVSIVRGIKIYNDSASTNPATTAAAIEAFPKTPSILIAGGHDKGLEYTPLLKALKHSTIRAVVLYGANKEKIKKAIKNSQAPTVTEPNLAQALTVAFEAALLFKSEKPIIIFSPGAASFDQFKSYTDRGRQFKALVRKLK